MVVQKHLEIITGKITNKREKSKLDELPTAQSTKPIYIRPQSAAPLAASLYATSSSAIGNNGRPMSATLRKQMREFSFGVSDLILTWNLLCKKNYFSKVANSPKRKCVTACGEIDQ